MRVRALVRPQPASVPAPGAASSPRLIEGSVGGAATPVLVLREFNGADAPLPDRSETMGFLKAVFGGINKAILHPKQFVEDLKHPVETTKKLFEADSFDPLGQALQ